MDTEKQQILKEMYLAGKQYKEIQQVLHCAVGVITYYVRKMNLPMRGSGTSKVPYNPFLEESPERDYWLGYLFADGHIADRQIILTTKEKHVADAFNAFFKNQCSIYKQPYKANPDNIIYRSTYLSKSVQTWFSLTYNIPTNKAKVLNPTVVINWDILRGYFEGDGFAHKKGGLGITTGSEIWAKRIQAFLKDNGIEALLHPVGAYYTVNVWKKSELEKLVDKLYYDGCFYCHEYKKKRLEPYSSNAICKAGELLES